MRKVALLALALGSITTALSADVIDFTPYAGYATVNMGSVHTAQTQYDDLLKSLLTAPSSTPITGGWIVGGDLLTNRLTPLDSLHLGLRAEYLGTNQASDDLTIPGGGGSLNTTENGSLSSVMLGGRYDLPGANYGLKLSVGAFAGIGYGTMTQNLTVSDPTESEAFNDLFFGTGFVGDLDLRLDWTIPGVQWLHINAQTGYRYASLGDLHDGNGQTFGGPGKYLGQITTDVPPFAAADVDFGGLTIGGGLTFDF